jgi:hypothetical protein
MKEVKIRLDEKTIEILSKIESFQRETFINYCIRLGENSDLYKVLTNEKAPEVSESLEEIKEDNPTKTKKEEKQEFDDFVITF